MRSMLEKLFRKDHSSRQGSDDDEASRVHFNVQSNNPSLPFRQGRLGIFRLDTPLLDVIAAKDLYDVDIVAIHGLCGDAHKSWTHENGTNWLRDLLPQAIPGARIFSYGYPSQLFFSRSVAGIRDYAVQLLSSLASERENDDHPRPIIYICHSLGGIVLKQAMIIAYERDQFRKEFLSSKGVVFMGTPHRGSALASPGKLLSDIANAALHTSGSYRFTGGINTPLVRNLRQNSTELLGIADSFTDRASVLRIITFYETEITPPSKSVIVEQSSAIIGLPLEQRTPLWANHQQLCRFATKDDKNYQQVSQAIKRTAKEILAETNQITPSINTEGSLNEAEKACMALLNTTDIAGYEAKLSRRVNGTLQWVLDNPQYTTWLSSRESRLLWVTGYAGCGKTILASYIIHCLAKRWHHHAIICRFFCDNKLETQRDATALLRSLIFQIVEGRRQLLRLVRKASDAQGFQMFYRFEALWNLFIQIIRDKRAGSINIIIDAIDECEDETLVVERIAGFLGDSSLKSVKFFITSRPTTSIARVLRASLNETIRLPLEEKQDLISKDVNLVISQRLEEIVSRGGCNPGTRTYLEKLLITKADRTFLWVTLVLSLLEERRLLQSSEIEKIAAQLPPNLTSIYEQLLYSIPTNDREVAGRMLRNLVVSARPLDGDEFGILLAIRTENRSLSSLGSQDILFGLDTAQAVLGPLIRISQSRIALVHQSLKDYLVELSCNPANPLAVTFGVDLQRDTLVVASACMRYLAFDNFEQSIFITDDSSDQHCTSSPRVDAFEQESNDESSVSAFDLSNDTIFKDESTVEAEMCTILADRYKLFNYAAMHWAIDFARINTAASDEQHQAAIALCISGSDRLANWFRYFWVMSGTREPYPSAVGPIMVTAFFGHIETLRLLLYSAEYRESRAEVYALYWAARKGHSTCVQILLEQRGVNLQSSLVNNQTPLVAAARYGHVQSVRVLLKDNRVNVNTQDIHGRTPLSLAAGNGDATTVAILLSHTKIEVDISDHSKATPLFWAVAAGSTQTTSQLVADDRVDLNHLDKRGRNALSFAAEDGSLDVVALLIQEKRMGVGSRDSRGKTPLSYAAQYGHLEVVRLLVRSKCIDISVRDDDGRNALSWAAAQRTYSVLHYLLKHDQAGADTEDRDGWTPLAWALNPPGYPDNIFCLIQSGLVNVNRKDRVHSRAPLSWAASYGYSSIVCTFLLVESIDLETRDNSGRTPLSHAASNGNIDVLRLLIETNHVDVDSKDAGGRTPLSWAAGEGRLEVVKELLSHPSVKVRSQDKYGRTALDFARAHGRENVAIALQR